MDRKSFIRNLALLGISPSAISSVFAGSSKGQKREKFTPSAVIFKVGKPKIKVSLPEKYSGPKGNLSVSVMCGDGAWDESSGRFGWARDYPVEFSRSDDEITAEVEMQNECRYTLIIKDRDIKTGKSKKDRYADVVAVIPLYALSEDVYGLRPFKGDSHIHSTNSDGRDSPENVALRCYEVGCDYQAISDHKVYATSEDVKQKFSAFPTSMSFFNAEECHHSYAHIQNFGASRSITEYINGHKSEFESAVSKAAVELPSDLPKILRRTVAEAEAEFDIIRKFGGIAVFNHPFWEANDKKGKFTYLNKSVIDLISKRKKFDAYEIVNSGCGDIALSLAICSYSKLCPEKPVIGCSDAHSVKAQGSGYTVVFAKSPDFSDIKKSILSGKSVAVYSYPSNNIAIGDERLVRFCYFLFDEYFPVHDKLVKKEGALIRKALKDGSTDFNEIGKVAQKVENLYESMLG